MASSDFRALKNKKIFISYSRRNAVQIEGLAKICEALGNEVFIDKKSIRSGRRWRQEIYDALDSADVLLVYWTKYSAASDEVTSEIDWFFKSNGDREIVMPVLGDATPLSERLSKYQTVDFQPIQEKLTQIKESMLAEKAKKNDIRAAIATELKEQGLAVEDSALTKVMGYFGLRGVEGYPQRFVSAVNGWFVESKYKLITIATAAALIGAIFGTLVSDPIDTQALNSRAPSILEMSVGLNQNGNQACEKAGLVCASVTQNWAYQLGPTRLYYGSATPSCTSTVSKSFGECSPGFAYEIEGVRYQKSPNAKTGADFSGSSKFCLEKPKLDFANCVEPLPDPE